MLSRYQSLLRVRSFAECRFVCISDTWTIRGLIMLIKPKSNQSILLIELLTIYATDKTPNLPSASIADFNHFLMIIRKDQPNFLKVLTAY